MTNQIPMPYHPDHPIQQMGKINYAQQHMAYYLSANRAIGAVYATENANERIQLFWWNFPHLIVSECEIGLLVKFPKCGA
jgi:hypothetical protein